MSRLETHSQDLEAHTVADIVIQISYCLRIRQMLIFKSLAYYAYGRFQSAFGYVERPGLPHAAIRPR